MLSISLLYFSVAVARLRLAAIEILVLSGLGRCRLATNSLLTIAHGRN
jgi:hypothetical protein